MHDHPAGGTRRRLLATAVAIGATMALTPSSALAVGTAPTTTTIESISPVTVALQPATIRVTVRSSGAPLAGTIDIRNTSGPEGSTWPNQYRLLGGGQCPGNSSICTVTATARTFLPPPDLNRVIAYYSGDDANAASQSEPVAVTVGWASTQGFATSRPSPTVYGQPVEIFTDLELLEPADRNQNPNWKIGATASARDDVTGTQVFGPRGGGGPVVFERLPAGAHRIAVTWSQATPFPTPWQPPAAPVYVDHVVRKASTTTGLIADTVGTEVRLAAPVFAVAPGSGLGTGEVTFRSGDEVIGRAQVGEDGTARLVTTLAPGQHTIHATYAGDANFEGSTSEPRRVTLAGPADDAPPPVAAQPRLLSARATTGGKVVARLRCARGTATVRATQGGKPYAQRSVRCTGRTMRVALKPEAGARPEGKIRVNVRFTQGGRATTKVKLPGQG